MTENPDGPMFGVFYLEFIEDTMKEESLFIMRTRTLFTGPVTAF